ncbi:hypothetical protein N7539_002722 [Penicillium diatomitis]|uniref:Ubiquitin-like domain-containing protein n=1 Tax=Penicillium diatomitis TaxID=2819901 RepID=A0A9X0BYW7_9EURO|nr:uncharacterized protein N7539_002722 [Penicillium diatomitis]KAJ5491155.1 hypothetical protein N7539_002722 [Penicillium diatomitis]
MNRTVFDQRSTHTARNASVATDTSATTQATRQRGRRGPALPLDQQYNDPLRVHVWYSKRRIWSRSDLERERREFFETRVTGRPEIWAALETALTIMRGGDLATAQSIIDAAGVTIPTGDLCEGCYDEQGVLYRLPQCIVSDPENMAQTTSSGADDAIRAIETTQDDGDLDVLPDGKPVTEDASGDELMADDLERRRDEKGKTSERDLVRVQARLSDRGGPDLTLTIGKSQSVGFLIRKIQQDAGVPDDNRVRIVHLGQILSEHKSLMAQGWQQGHVINAFIVPRGPDSS